MAQSQKQKQLLDHDMNAFTKKDKAVYDVQAEHQAQEHIQHLSVRLENRSIH